MWRRQQTREVTAARQLCPDGAAALNTASITRDTTRKRMERWRNGWRNGWMNALWPDELMMPSVREWGQFIIKWNWDTERRQEEPNCGVRFVFPAHFSSNTYIFVLLPFFLSFISLCYILLNLIFLENVEFNVWNKLNLQKSFVFFMYINLYSDPTLNSYWH